MDNDTEPILSRTSEEIFLQDITTASVSSEIIEDGQDRTRSTVLPNHILDLINTQKRLRVERELNTATYTKYNIIKRGSHTEDHIDLQCSSAQNYIGSNVDREPIFVIVDSSCVSNPSSKEILITKINIVEESSINKNPKNKVIPTDTPCTSKSFAEFVSTQNRACESVEELEMVAINLQSDNEIFMNSEEFDNDPESIVLTYLREKDLILDKEEPTSTKKKSSLLENVPKMETIPEVEQFSAFSVKSNDGPSHNSKHKTNTDKNNKISENSLDVHIPSYPGSPRSIDLGPGPSLESFSNVNPNLREAIDFLHVDKELLIAAEVGNTKLLDILIRRGTDLQQIDHLGRNALHLAVCSGNTKAVKLLLNAGVKANVKDKLGMTPLSLSLMRRPSTIVANLLFDHGALLMPRSDPMDIGLFIQFVMMCIPTSEEENILRLLVDKGAIINDPEAPGKRQALHFAAMSNNTNLIRILIALGADSTMTNHRGETPKQVAGIFKSKEAFELLTELEEAEVVSISSASNLSFF